MPRRPKVHYHDRDQCWITTAVGEFSETSGRRKGVRNYEIGPPTGKEGPANEAKAQLWLAELLRAESEGTRRATDPLLSDLILAFLAHAERLAAAGERSLRTIEGHAERLDTFAAFRHGALAYGDIPVSRLRPADLSRFIRECRARGLAPGYINSIIISVQALMNWAARPVPDRGQGWPERVIAANPFKGVERPKNPAPPQRYVGARARREFYEYATLRALLHPAGSSASRYDRLFVALVRFCEETGCRPGEACRLEWRHIRWEEGRAVLKGKATGRTGRMRVLPLVPSVLRMLRAIEALPGHHPDYVFTHLARDGRGRRESGDLSGIPWRVGALDQKLRLWREAAEAVGVTTRGETGEPLTLYGLRRDMGSDILRLTGSYAESAEVLGHSPEMSRRHYASFEEERAVELARAVAERRRGDGRAG
jgi:integrase